MEGLTPGRAVHYVDEAGRHNAALVAGVCDEEEGIVNLCVVNLLGETRSEPFVLFEASGKETETWHFIERG